MGSKSSGSAGDAVYALGIIGAAIYFISAATSFWMGVVGILKAFVWPAILVYEVLKNLA
jgi:phage-related protein